MKRTLLFAAVLTSAAASAQTVNAFYPLNLPETNYTLLTSSAAIDESTAGENVAWNFSGLTVDSYSATNVNEPSAEAAEDFPGTTSVVVTVSESSYTSEFYLANAANGDVALTGAATNGIILNYEDDNMSLGAFPKSYENSAVTDNVAGTFEGEGVAGTFTGTATTLVDGYGTLTINVGPNLEPVTINVTRLKIQQDLNLVYSGLPVGTLTQVMYSYFAETPVNAPVFRTLTATASIPLLNINETQQSIESYFEAVAGAQTPQAQGALSIAPNPVDNTLHIAGGDVTGITVIDVMGRIVLRANGNNTNVSSLSKGVYTVSAVTATGVKTLKMVKQ